MGNCMFEIAYFGGTDCNVNKYFNQHVYVVISSFSVCLSVNTVVIYLPQSSLPLVFVPITPNKQCVFNGTKTGQYLVNGLFHISL